MKDMLPLWAMHLDCPEEIRGQLARIVETLNAIPRIGSLLT